MKRRWLLTLGLWLAASTGRADPAPEPPAPVVAPRSPLEAVGLGSLRLLREKNLITDEDLARATADLQATVGTLASEAPTLGTRWSATLYGFLNLAAIADTTQGLGDVLGNATVARPDVYEGQHGRLTFSVRFTRLGLALRSPEWHHVRASGLIEIDALGAQSAAAQESVNFTSPALRIFNAALKIETPIVDVLIGQWWSLFGWQPYFFPSFNQYSGLPGILDGRTAQIKLSHLFHGPGFGVELAVAAARPPARDSFVPEIQGGIRLVVDSRVGYRTVQAVGSGTMPLSVGVSGTLRRYAEYSQEQMQQVDLWTGGVAVDALVPIVPARGGRPDNALTATGSFAWGAGIADAYLGLQSGLPLPTTAQKHIDPGLVAFNPAGALEALRWRSFAVGLQYYLPVPTLLWLAANYTQLDSDNVLKYGVNFQVYTQNRSVDGNLTWEVVPGLRLGLSYTWVRQIYGDGVAVANHRSQLSAYYLF